MKFALGDVEPDYLLLGALFASSLALTYIGVFVDMIFGGLIAVFCLDLAVGYPLYKRSKRIAQMERALPDVMTSMAATLQAGGTIESSLKDASRGRYGPISEELRRMLREVKRGKTFEAAFSDFARRTESVNIQRSVDVIISAKRTGGGLVQALRSIADDLKNNQRLIEERKSITLLQIIFIIVAADIIGPAILGLVSGITVFLASIGGNESNPVLGTVVFYLKGYIVVSAIFSALAAAVIREGDVTKSVLYLPILLTLAYTIYVGVGIVAKMWFGF
ncbi:MAG: type II secretion system F family protein [Candidatus Diapherotrites archaeon]|nr:type II secretion system F family protein [Candidatus Diapherotrites archaeon]